MKQWQKSNERFYWVIYNIYISLNTLYLWHSNFDNAAKFKASEKGKRQFFYAKELCKVSMYIIQINQHWVCFYFSSYDILKTAHKLLFNISLDLFNPDNGANNRVWIFQYEFSESKFPWMLIWNLLLLFLFIVVLLLLMTLMSFYYFFFSSRLTYTMEINIPYIEIIPENSDALTGPDGTNVETSSEGMITFYSFHYW